MTRQYNATRENHEHMGLIISRRVNEEVYIIPREPGKTPIKLIVVGLHRYGRLVESGKVVLAINAPRESYIIIRPELLREAGREYSDVIRHLEDNRPVTREVIEKLDSLRR